MVKAGHETPKEVPKEVPKAVSEKAKKVVEAGHETPKEVAKAAREEAKKVIKAAHEKAKEVIKAAHEKAKQRTKACTKPARRDAAKTLGDGKAAHSAAQPTGDPPRGPSPLTDSHIWAIVEDPGIRTILDESAMSKTEARALMDRFDTTRQLLNTDRRFRQRLAELDRRKQVVEDYLRDTGAAFVENVYLADSLQGLVAQADEIMKTHSDELIARCRDEANTIDTTFSAISLRDARS